MIRARERGCRPLSHHCRHRNGCCVVDLRTDHPVGDPRIALSNLGIALEDEAKRDCPAIAHDGERADDVALFTKPRTHHIDVDSTRNQLGRRREQTLPARRWRIWRGRADDGGESSSSGLI
jgi:hypothetical protein